MDRLGIEEGEHIEHSLISKAIENAQSKVEGHNFEVRKQLLEYDDVMNQQREIIYRQRREALEKTDLKSNIMDMVEDRLDTIVGSVAREKIPVKEWDLDGLKAAVKRQFSLDPVLDDIRTDASNADDVFDILFSQVKEKYNRKEDDLGHAQIREVERFILLQTVDTLWKEHLLAMDHLKEGIGLRGYGQQNPLRVYKKEGFDMFQALSDRIQEEVLGILFRIEMTPGSQAEEMRKKEEENLSFSHSGNTTVKQPVKRTQKKIGRNDSCPCGSGKKYKKCCGS
jgi:preprotein translocase subunit SecA